MITIKKPILGFEHSLNAEFKKIDNIFAILNVDNISIPLINPYVFIKDYSFEIPADVRVLLDIKENDGVYVYVPFVKNRDIEKSVVNFKAPILINPKNNTLAQLILDNYDILRLVDLVKE